MKSNLSVEMEAAIIKFALLSPDKSYLAVSEELNRQGLNVAPGVIRGIYSRNNMKTFFDRLRVLEDDSEARGIPVDSSIQAKLLKQRLRLTDSGISKLSRPHEVVAWHILNLRLSDNRMIYLTIFFDLFTNTAEVRSSILKNDVRLMEVLDSYLVYLRAIGEILPEVLITTASPAVAGNSEQNPFRARLARDGIVQLIARPRSTNLSRHIQSYATELKALLNESLQEITQAAGPEDYKLTDVDEIVSDLSDALNEEWKTRPLIDGPICGLPAEEL